MQKILTTISTLLFALLITQSCNSKKEKIVEIPKTALEQKFDSVMIQTKEGEQLSLLSYLDSLKTTKPIVLITTFDFCIGCKQVITKVNDYKNKNQDFELIAFYIDPIDSIGKINNIKNQAAFEKMVQNSKLECKTIFDPTGSYINHVLDGEGNTPQTNIILNDSIVYYNFASDYITYWDEDALIIDALASQKEPIYNKKTYRNGKKQLSYGFDNFKRIGEWKRHRKNGKLRSITTYTDGKKEGEEKVYYTDGQLGFIKTYSKGKKNGEFKYYWENGNVLGIENYKQDTLIGENKSYFKNGKPEKVSNFLDGKLSGAFKQFHENGKTKRIGNYLDHKVTGEWKFFYENGQTSSISNYLDGKLSGLFKQFHENGKTKSIGNYSDDKQTGEWKFFYENGQTSSISNYLYGKLSGAFKQFHENGKTKNIGNNLDDKRTGEWKFFYENGQTSSISNYLDGKLSGAEQEFHENGKTKRIGNYLDDKRTGEWKFFYENGNPWEVINYLGGERSGEYKYYNDNGELYYEGKYLEGKTNGEWKNYHKNGQLYQTRLWKKGRYMDLLTCFDGEGNPLKRGTLVNGNGSVRNYNQTGKLLNVVTYTDGLNLKGMWNNATKLNTWAWDAYENEANQDKLAKAITWVKRSIKLEENYANLDTYAALLFKTNKAKQAIIMANKAIAKAKEEDTDYSSTTELIKKINTSLEQNTTKN